MRSGIIPIFALAVLTASKAQAEIWCAYVSSEKVKEKAMIDCGYSGMAECENAIGHNGTCFVDPNLAFNVNKAAPAFATPETPAKWIAKGSYSMIPKSGHRFSEKIMLHQQARSR